MNNTFQDEIKIQLNAIVSYPHLHAKWLNTLSYLENCGARKIASCEHPTLVKEEMIKHAAEEFRHAYYLKRQIKRISNFPLIDYAIDNMLGGIATRHYLNKLDVHVSRFLKTQGLSPSAIKATAYVLVTYVIELRAAELYPIYDEILKKNHSPITIKSILLEEKEHLKEMEDELSRIKNGEIFMVKVRQIEEIICQRWIENIKIR